MTGWRTTLGVIGAVLLCLTAWPTLPRAAALGPDHEEFTNPILAAGADPSLTYYQGRFHLVQGDSFNNDNVVIRTADTLGGLGDAPPVVVWRHPDCPAPACTKIWAPELQRIGDRWWIYFAAQDSDDPDTHRMYALRSTGDDPAGPYEFAGKLDLPRTVAIDGVYLAYRSQGYFLWSCLRPDDELVQEICAVRMSDPTTPVGAAVAIATPTAAWETVPNEADRLINEAPQPLAAPDGTLYLTYSANASFDDSYRLGLMQLARGGDPMDPAAWTKSGGPILPGGPGAIAPGHNGFFTVDGHPWITYHARLDPGTGWAGRSIRAQPMTFGPDNRPRFGMAARPGVTITVGTDRTPMASDPGGTVK
ncbi:family 43 glycosylhydrolase [Nocardia sp. NPDC059240]|uniref:glycoside hydrolase family 43 protein n=1 Tax=Nocardia sp. NPDC059240 TaxID=3346786 RepID=UPI0036849F76